jgi:hypothetical protein
MASDEEKLIRECFEAKTRVCEIAIHAPESRTISIHHDHTEFCQFVTAITPHNNSNHSRAWGIYHSHLSAPTRSSDRAPT